MFAAIESHTPNVESPLRDFLTYKVCNSSASYGVVLAALPSSLWEKNLRRNFWRKENILWFSDLAKLSSPAPSRTQLWWWSVRSHSTCLEKSENARMGGTLLPPHSGDFRWTPGWESSQLPCTHTLASMHAHVHVHAPPPPIPRASAYHPKPCRIRSPGSLRNYLGRGSKLMSHVTSSAHKRVGFSPESTSAGIQLGAEYGEVLHATLNF